MSELTDVNRRRFLSAHPAKQEPLKNKRRASSSRSMVISPSTYLAAVERDSTQPLNASQGVNNTFFGMTYRTGPGGTFEKSGPSPSGHLAAFARPVEKGH